MILLLSSSIKFVTKSCTGTKLQHKRIWYQHVQKKKLVNIHNPPKIHSLEKSYMPPYLKFFMKIYFFIVITFDIDLSYI